MIDLEALPGPLDDDDTGYADEKEVAELPERVDLVRVKAAVKEMRSSPPESPDIKTPREFGEVEEPDEDDNYLDPDDLYGGSDPHDGDYET